VSRWTLPSAIADIWIRRCHSRRSICIPRYRESLIDRKRFRMLRYALRNATSLPQETSMRSSRSSDSAARRSLAGIASVTACAVLAGIAVGAMPSDSTRSAATAFRTFDPALLCRPQTNAALQTRAAKRVSSGRAP
jgi:hypothetical protein